MKHIKKIKLSELSKKELEARQMKVLKGGDYCSDKCGTGSSLSSVYSSWFNEFYG